MKLVQPGFIRLAVEHLGFESGLEDPNTLAGAIPAMPCYKLAVNPDLPVILSSSGCFTIQTKAAEGAIQHWDMETFSKAHLKTLMLGLSVSNGVHFEFCFGVLRVHRRVPACRHQPFSMESYSIGNVCISHNLLRNE